MEAGKKVVGIGTPTIYGGGTPSSYLPKVWHRYGECGSVWEEQQGEHKSPEWAIFVVLAFIAILLKRL